MTKKTYHDYNQFRITLLNTPQVLDEIKRHLWIESEKAGHDMGYEWALEDWFMRFAGEWIQFHRPDLLRESEPRPKPARKNVMPVRKKRRAKSYLI